MQNEINVGKVLNNVIVITLRFIFVYVVYWKSLVFD